MTPLRIECPGCRISCEFTRAVDAAEWRKAHEASCGRFDTKPSTNVTVCISASPAKSRSPKSPGWTAADDEAYLAWEAE